MALPTGITPKTVTIGIGSFFDGTLVEGTVTITAPVNVLHIPTGRPIFSSSMTQKFVDGEATFSLCPTDDPNLNRVDWTYKLNVKVTGAGVQPDPIYFTLPAAGPDTVDLDALVSVPSSAGTPVSVTAVTSVAGQTGTVSSAQIAAALDTDGTRLSDASLRAAFARPATDLVLYVAPTGSDSNSGLAAYAPLATIDAAFAKCATAGGGVVVLSGGTHVSPSTGQPSYTRVIGQGRRVTVVRIPDGASARTAFANADTTNGNDGLSISNLTIDGNKANASGTSYGVHWLRARSSEIRDVEVHDCPTHGLFIDGNEADDSRYLWLTNIESHHNGQNGGHVGNGQRAVYYSAVSAHDNGAEGWRLDHSETIVEGLHCFANATYGIWIRNVFACSYTNLVANKNGQHGIYVNSMSNCTGAAWQAQNNGTAGPSGTYNDVHFSATQMYYGLNRDSVVTGIKCGPAVAPNAWKPPNTTAIAEGYGLYVEDGQTANLKLLDVEASVGTTGSIRLPDQRGQLMVRQTLRGVVADLLDPVDVGAGTASGPLMVYTIPANTTVRGDHYRIRWMGTIDYIATSGNINFYVQIGNDNKVLAQVAVSSQSSAATGKQVQMVLDVVCTGVAAGVATWECTGTANLDFSTTTNRVVNGSNTRAMTNDADLKPVITWATPDAGNVLHVKTCTITKER